MVSVVAASPPCEVISGRDNRVGLQLWKQMTQQPDFEKYKKPGTEHSEIRREKQKKYERNIARKSKDYPKLFHRFIKSKLSVKDKKKEILQSFRW